MHSTLRSLKIAPLVAAIVFVLIAGSTRAAPPHTITEEVLNVQIGKWQVLSLQWISHPPHEGGVLVLDLIEGTRDRDGQGVFTGSMYRILHATEEQVTVRNRNTNALLIEIAYEGVSGPSRVKLDATVSGQGEERYAKLSIDGNGPVYEHLMRELDEHFESADWVQSLKDAKWSYQPPQEGTTMPKAGGGAISRLQPRPGSSLIPAPAPAPLPQAKPAPIAIPVPKAGANQ